MMRKRTVLLAALAAFCLSGCAMMRTEIGNVGGVSYRMSTKRPAMPGGKRYSLTVVKKRRGAKAGELWIDGISFGQVERGSYVEVTDSAEVFVDGDERFVGGAVAPQTDSGASSQPTSR